MKIKNLVIIFILCMLAGVIYFIFNNHTKIEETNPSITYETINMKTNLRLGISEFDTIHPYLTNNREVIYIDRILFEPLLSINHNNTITNCLANEWCKIENKTYLIKLKEDILWSDGTSLSANDVKFSVEELQKYPENIYYENVKEIEQVEIIDSLTLKIQLKKEIPFFEYNLIFPILCEKQKTDANTIPKGTGRYKINKIDETKVELELNPHWREIQDESPNTKTITIYFYSNMGEVYNAFKLKNIDIIHTTNMNIEEYIGSMGYGKETYNGRQLDYIAMNCENTILQYPEVRRAISLSINKQNIVETTLQNKAKIANYPLDESNYLISSINQAQEFNIQEAKKILQKAGWNYENNQWQKVIEGKIKIISFTLSVRKNDAERVEVAKEIQKQLEAVGIKVKIKQIAESTYQNYLKYHQYEMLLTGIYSSLSPDLTSFLGENNLANYQNEEINNILKELNNISQEKLQKEKYQKIWEIYNNEVPYITLYRLQEIIAYTNEFRGEVAPNQYQIYDKIYSWYVQT